MPEEEFETAEFKERLEEATERAVEASEQRSRWLLYLSLSTAIIAVMAAIAALESGTFSNEALIQKNDALLAQTKASDQWAYYQAKGIKAAVYASQGAVEKAAQETTEQQEISKSAKEFENEVQRSSEESQRSLEHHHRFAYAVTMFQVSIALAAVAALSRQKIIWLVGLAISLMGITFFLNGFLLLF
jgi:Domain of unknown function (DUF4337)